MIHIIYLGQPFYMKNAKIKRARQMNRAFQTRLTRNTCRMTYKMKILTRSIVNPSILNQRFRI